MVFNSSNTTTIEQQGVKREVLCTKPGPKNIKLVKMLEDQVTLDVSQEFSGCSAFPVICLALARHCTAAI